MTDHEHDDAHEPVAEPLDPAPGDALASETAADPVEATDAGEPSTSPGASPVRPSLRSAGLWLLLVGGAIALDGLVGGLALVFVAAVLLAGLAPRVLGAVGVALLALAPVAFLIEGIPTSRTISPQIVLRSLLPHHLTFAGLVLVSAYAIVDLLPHLRSWAAAERTPQDDGPPLGAVAGVVVVAAVGLGALLACRAVLGA